MSNAAPHNSMRGKMVGLRAAEATRLRRIAALRNRGLSLEEITEALKQSGVVNPNTQKAWSCSAVYNDLNKLLKNDQIAASRDYAEWRAQHLAEINEALRQAWADHNLDAVAKFLAQRAKFFGLNAPDKTEHTGANGGPITWMALVESAKR